ncbi:MAG: HAD-IA family hydrolase [Clostridiales Family XIII bacterium]|nr:HAD-IA family hydrolase [Clostridiales Family XIII bacterium]
MGINTVLFDFDGTLMDTNQLIIDSWQHLFRTLEGRERPVGEILKTLGEPLAYTMHTHFPGVSIEEAVKIYRSYHGGCFEERVGIFPGIQGLLERLKKGGYKLGIVTSRLKNTTWIGLDKFGIGGYFGAVVTCEDTEKNKPDPAPVLLALERLGSKPEEAAMVGDTMSDIRCARAAGVMPILAGWSVSVPEAAQRGEGAPEHIAADAEALAAIILAAGR